MQFTLQSMTYNADMTLLCGMCMSVCVYWLSCMWFVWHTVVTKWNPRNHDVCCHPHPLTHFHSVGMCFRLRSHEQSWEWQLCIMQPVQRDTEMGRGRRGRGGRETKTEIRTHIQTWQMTIIFCLFGGVSIKHFCMSYVSYMYRKSEEGRRERLALFVGISAEYVFCCYCCCFCCCENIVYKGYQQTTACIPPILSCEHNGPIPMAWQQFFFFSFEFR